MVKVLIKASRAGTEFPLDRVAVCESGFQAVDGYQSLGPKMQTVGVLREE